MANYTTNLELEKPIETEAYDIKVFNRNMDKLDEEVAKKLDKTNKSTSAEAIAGENDTKYITPLSLKAVIEEIENDISSVEEIKNIAKGEMDLAYKAKIETLERDVDGIKASKRKVLWKNSDPSIGINANTVINLSSDDYDELVWFYIYSNAEENLSLQCSTSCQKGNSVLLDSIGYSTGNNIRRILDYVSDVKYQARVGKNGDTDSATHCIPVEVVGIKY